METTTVPTEAPKPTAAQEIEQPKEKCKPMARTPRNASEPASETKWPYAWKCEQASNATLIPLEQIKCVPDRKIDELAQQKTAQQHGRENEQRPQAVDASDCGQGNR